MTRYYFQLIERDGTTTPDEEGMELPDDAAAIGYAHAVARDLAGDFVKEAEVINGQHIDVLKNGKVITTVYLRHEIKITPNH